MKKLIVLFTFLAFYFISACSPAPCICTGKFQMQHGSKPTFTVDSVDCETGYPFIKENEPQIPIFLGCD